MPAYFNASLVFSFEGASITENVLEGSLPSKSAQAGTNVVAFDEAIASIINRLSISILLRTLAPHLVGFLPQSTVPPSSSIVPSFIATTASSLPLARPNDLTEDFLQHFIDRFHQLLSRCISLILVGRGSYDLGRPMLLTILKISRDRWS